MTYKRQRIQAVYLITNLATGKVYVGSSVDVDLRWRRHRNALNKGKHHSRHLQRAWDAYGAPFFCISILEQVPNLEELRQVEKRWLDHLRAADGEHGYNCSTDTRCPGGWPKGRIRPPVSEETRRRIGEAGKGRPGFWTGKKRPPPSEETRMKISLAGKGRASPTKGRKLGPRSIETRQKISTAAKNRIPIDYILIDLNGGRRKVSGFYALRDLATELSVNVNTLLRTIRTKRFCSLGYRIEKA